MALTYSTTCHIIAARMPRYNMTSKQKTPFGISEERLEIIAKKAAKVIAVGFLIYIGLRLASVILLIGETLAWSGWVLLPLFTLLCLLIIVAIIRFARRFLFKYWK